MNLTKSFEFFDPNNCPERIHIIGCGAIGSTLAENLVRFGLTKITLYDFDYVEPQNIANQMFRATDIGKPKVEALADMLRAINPDMGDDLKLIDDGWHGQKMSGYVFLCVDNIDLRREIATACRSSRYIKAMFDFRMRLTDAQHYAADWSSLDNIEAFLSTMDFTHEEAAEATPVSACNITLSVVPTVRMIVACGVSNFVNFALGKELKTLILIDSFEHAVTAI